LVVIPAQRSEEKRSGITVWILIVIIIATASTPDVTFAQPDHALQAEQESRMYRPLRRETHLQHPATVAVVRYARSPFALRHPQLTEIEGATGREWPCFRGVAGIKVAEGARIHRVYEIFDHSVKT